MVTPLEGVAIAAGVLLAGLGLWFIRAGRGREAGSGPGISLPTRLVLGVSCLLSGYHVAMWFGPVGMLSFGIPIGLWWALAAGVGVATVASAAMDRVDAACHGGVTNRE